MKYILLILALLCTASISYGQLAQRISALQNEEGRFVPPSKKELDQAESLFTRTMSWEELLALKRAWASIEMDCQSIEIANKNGYLVYEKPGCQRGRGIFLFLESESKVFLQAPHSFFDRGTGKIVSLLLVEDDFGGACWNSVPRYALGHYKGPADTQAHMANYFVAFARAFAKTKKNSYLVQLHGFGAHKRKSEAGKAAGAIISSGTGKPGFYLRTLVASMKVQFPKPIRLYPHEVQELGATRNVSGKTLRQYNHPGFVHIEFSGKLRQRLLAEKGMRSKLSRRLLRFLN